MSKNYKRQKCHESALKRQKCHDGYSRITRVDMYAKSISAAGLCESTAGWRASPEELDRAEQKESTNWLRSRDDPMLWARNDVGVRKVHEGDCFFRARPCASCASPSASSRRRSRRWSARGAADDDPSNCNKRAILRSEGRKLRILAQVLRGGCTDAEATVLIDTSTERHHHAVSDFCEKKVSS